MNVCVGSIYIVLAPPPFQLFANACLPVLMVPPTNPTAATAAARTSNLALWLQVD